MTAHSQTIRPPAPVHRIASAAEALDTARRLAETFRAGAAQRDRERRLPWREVEEYTASGLGAITIPREFGGADLPLATVAKVFEILSAADPSLGQIPQSQFGVLAQIRDFGTPVQKARIFGDVLNGWRIGNAGPERTTKTIAVSTTRVEETPEGPRLTGRRYYSTGALFAHWIPSRAVDGQGRPVQVWVRHDAPGVRVVDDWDSFGQKTTASGTVIFEQVPIDPELVLPVWSFASRPGLAGPTSQLIQAAIDSGIASAAIEDTLAFIRDKARPWHESGVDSAAEDPTILHEIGGLHAGLHAAQEVLYAAGDAIDAIGRLPVTEEASARASVAVAEAKILTTEIALEATEKLFDLAGSSATRAAHGLDRHWRNARVHTLHDPVRWKYHLIGNFELNGIFPNRHQWN